MVNAVSNGSCRDAFFWLKIRSKDDPLVRWACSVNGINIARLVGIYARASRKSGTPLRETLNGDFEDADLQSLVYTPEQIYGIKSAATLARAYSEASLALEESGVKSELSALVRALISEEVRHPFKSGKATIHKTRSHLFNGSTMQDSLFLNLREYVSRLTSAERQAHYYVALISFESELLRAVDEKLKLVPGYETADAEYRKSGSADKLVALMRNVRSKMPNGLKRKLGTGLEIKAEHIEQGGMVVDSCFYEVRENKARCFDLTPAQNFLICRDLLALQRGFVDVRNEYSAFSKMKEDQDK